MSSSFSGVDLKSKQQPKHSVKELLLKYAIYLPFIIISIVISVAICYIYLKYQSPVYSSYISVYFPEETKGSGGADASVLSEVLLFDKKVNLTNEIQVLKSKSVMARVVSKLNLNLLYFKKGEFKLNELYRPTTVTAKVVQIKDSSASERVEIVKEKGKLYKLDGEVKTLVAAQSVIPGKNVLFNISIDPNSLQENEKYVIEWHPVDVMASQLSGGLGISQPQQQANILNYSINTEVPEKGRDILNALVVEHNMRNNEQKNRLVDYTLEFIDERVELMRGELGKVESGLQSYRQAEVIAPEAQSSLGLGELTEAENKIDNSEIQLQLVTMLRQSLAIPNQPIPTTLGVEDPGLASLVQQYNQYIFQKEEQLKTMPAANPAVRVTQSHVDRLRGTILTNLDNITASNNQMRRRFSANLQSGRSKLRSVPRQERQLLEMSRQQDIKEKLFMFLLQKKEEAAITKASSISSNSIPLDPAVTAGLVSPNKMSIYRMGILLGILIPGLIIYLKELLNDKIITRHDIAGKTRTPIIGEISHNSDKKRRLVVSFDDRTVMGEQFRMLRANIPFLTKSQQKKVILFTSTTSGEGKTFCSLNLGAVYAIAGKRTVIVEMDLRKPKVTQALNMNASAKGITHYISDQADLDELPIAVPDVKNLYVITAGIIPPNPSEILMDEKIEAFFDYLKENFDFIVVDCAPLGLVSDAKILAKHADATIYVVRQRKTPKKQLQAINDLYESELFPNLSLLVNDVKANGADSYYGYGGNYMSNYKYSYGKEQKTFWEKAKTKMKVGS